MTGRASLYAMPRVVGGVDAVEREFPWTVNVEDEESLIGMCGGSIIRKDVILTAAHCVRYLTLVFLTSAQIYMYFINY